MIITHDEEPIHLDTKLCPHTGYECEEGYLETVKNNIDKIFDQQTNFKRMSKYNIQLDPDFTYGQLKDFLN